MDKSKLIEFIIMQLEKDLAALTKAYQATFEAATHEENKPENEYDTRGLEQSYLAGAQAKRVTELEEVLYLFKNIEPRDFNEKTPIAATALVEVELNAKKLFVLIMAKGGGQTLTFEGHTVQVITPQSPLGQALLSHKSGDVIIVEAGKNILEYDIISVC